MTHWLVYVAKAGKALKELGKIVKQQYDNDKRKFVEFVVNYSLQVIIGIWALISVVLPIPTIPKQTTFDPYNLIFVIMKPFWLHILGLFGVLYFLNPRMQIFRGYTSWIFWCAIKIHGYLVFLKSRNRNRIAQ